MDKFYPIDLMIFLMTIIQYLSDLINHISHISLLLIENSLQNLINFAGILKLSNTLYRRCFTMLNYSIYLRILKSNEKSTRRLLIIANGIKKDIAKKLGIS